ncbi:hypothetical protein LDHU3_36.8790:CDS1 [Leishmania donovani]|nr:hypothetical protein LDHU3_36.8790:CDS1 [Leishmania donovani]
MVKSTFTGPESQTFRIMVGVLFRRHI